MTLCVCVCVCVCVCGVIENSWEQYIFLKQAWLFRPWCQYSSFFFFFFLKKKGLIYHTRGTGILVHDGPLWQASEKKNGAKGGCLNPRNPPPPPRMCLYVCVCVFVCAVLWCMHTWTCVWIRWRTCRPPHWEWIHKNLWIYDAWACFWRIYLYMYMKFIINPRNYHQTLRRPQCIWWVILFSYENSYTPMTDTKQVTDDGISKSRYGDWDIMWEDKLIAWHTINNQLALSNSSCSNDVWFTFEEQY